MLRNRRQKIIVGKQILFINRPGRYGGWTARWSRALGHLPLPFRKRGRVKVTGVVQGCAQREVTRKMRRRGCTCRTIFVVERLHFHLPSRSCSLSACGVATRLWPRRLRPRLRSVEGGGLLRWWPRLACSVPALLHRGVHVLMACFDHGGVVSEKTVSR